MTSLWTVVGLVVRERSGNQEAVRRLDCTSNRREPGLDIV